jgi:L-prolyl-PCP dehydrogenase
VFSLCAHLLACAVPLWKAGDDRQRERFLIPLASGHWIGANAITEPEAGSDVFSLKTTAVRRGDHYVLNGAKRFITNSPVADLFLVYATVNPNRGLLGVTAFLLPRDTLGLEVSPNLPKVGLRSCLMGEVVFRDCAVPMENRMGAEGAGGMIFSESMIWERACLFAASLGSMQRQLEDCLEHAKGRTQFGQSIGKFQSVSNRLVDMKLRLESSRWLLYRGGWLLEQGCRCELEVALSKLNTTENAVLSGLDAIQIYGGNGCLSENGIDLPLRDAILARIYSGTSEMQQQIIAHSLGL